MFVCVALMGCTIRNLPAYERNLPAELDNLISVGDSRSHVHAMLGGPMISAQDYGIEIYKKSGRDWHVDWIFPYLVVPAPGAKVITYVMIVFDSANMVSEVKSDILTNDEGFFPEFSLEANGLKLINSFGVRPNTLLGPKLDLRDQIIANSAERGACFVYFTMLDCPMEHIEIDGKELINFSPFGKYCKDGPGPQINSFIETRVGLGRHEVNVRLSTLTNDKLSHHLACVGGKSFFVRLEGTVTCGKWKWKCVLEGDLVVTDEPPQVSGNNAQFRRILWHEGRWLD